MAKLSVNFHKEVFNDVFYPLLFDKSDFLFLKGSASSGKSHFLGQKVIWRILSEPNHRIVMNRKVGKTIRNSQYKLLCDLINAYNLNSLFRITDSDMTIKCPQTNGEILAIGMDDKEKIKSLTKPTMGWFDEVTELKYLEFTQFTLRFRGIYDHYVQLMGSFNPVDENHWIHNEMFPPQIDEVLKKRPYAKMVRKIEIEHQGKKKQVALNYKLCHSTYKDNKFLSIREKAVLEDLKNKDHNYYKVYCLGEWGSIGNLVFQPAPPLVPFPEDDKFKEIVYGLDFGYHHPSALVKVGIRDEDELGLCFYEKEILYIKKLTNLELIEYIKKHNLVDKNDVIYADSSEPARIAEFAEADFNIRAAVKGQHSVKNGIDYMKSINRFVDPESVNLIREYRQYCYKTDKKKDDNPIDEPYPYNDDCISAARYAEYSWSRLGDVKVGFIDMREQ